jgi:hypothetical protein
MERDLAIDHVLLAAADLAHIGSARVGNSAEAGSIAHDMGDKRRANCRPIRPLT